MTWRGKPRLRTGPPRLRFLVPLLLAAALVTALSRAPETSCTRRQAARADCSDAPGGFAGSTKPAGRAVVWAVGDGGDGSDAAKGVVRIIASGGIDRLLYLGDV